MNKTEDQAKEYLISKGVSNCCFQDDGVADEIEKLLTEFANSQPLNLDVKVDDELNPVTKPLGYGKEHYADLHVTDQKKWNAYDKARTIRERFADLTKERDELKREKQQLSNDLHDCRTAFSAVDDELQAVTKERDELKDRINSWVGKARTQSEFVEELQIELQAEKKKVEEIKTKLNDKDFPNEINLMQLQNLNDRETYSEMFEEGILAAIREFKDILNNE